MAGLRSRRQGHLAGRSRGRHVDLSAELMPEIDREIDAAVAFSEASPVPGRAQSRTIRSDGSTSVRVARATEEPIPYNRIVRLLMLTAMRKTIFGRLRRTEVKKDDRTVEVGIEVSLKGIEQSEGLEVEDFGHGVLPLVDEHSMARRRALRGV